jgi:hypothetical protein
MNMVIAVDHLVVGASTLEEGVRWCADILGVTPGPGGKHPLMSTHNRLFGTSSDEFPNTFFEIIAIDPDAPPPGRARWFGLDTVDLARGPRLVTFVARTTALDASLATLRDAGVDGGRALAASRDTPSGLLRWWGEQRHPAASMPASGVVLRSLVLRGVPRGALDIVHVRIADTSGPALEAQFDTPRGTITLTSS